MIRIEDLSVSFGATDAVRHVSLEIAEGEILGVVGESGSGKSVTALTLMGLVSPEATVKTGRILYGDQVLLEAGKPRDEALYRKFQGSAMSMIFQEPMTSLNPTKRVGNQVEEMLILHTQLDGAARRERVLESFRDVGLRDVEKVYGQYPHQLSGGMRQRVMIAMAVILHPALVVADEPTTALDVTVQNQIIRLLREINREQKNAMLFITHDLNLARRLCDRIAVMKDGRVVESGNAQRIFRSPREAYTQSLIEAVPTREKKKPGAGAGAAAAQALRAASTVSVSVSEPALPEVMESPEPPIVEVRDLNVYYPRRDNSLFGRRGKRCVVEHASFQVFRGETLGLVGESGCGKTSLSKAILGMNRDIEGTVINRTVRPQMIFQDPYSSLNPAKTVGWLLQEPLRARGRLEPDQAMSRADLEAAAYDMLHRVGLQDKYFDRLPSELSGGQRQRISIGQALITRPELVLADEPVSALDVTIQAQIMELMRSLQREMKVSYLFISHDINVVYQMSDRIMVMKEGKILEIGETEEVFGSPKEEYTKLLLAES